MIRIGVADDRNGHDILNILKRVYSPEGLSPTIAAHSGGNTEPKVAINEKLYRKLTPRECEKLQTLPVDYTAGVSNTQRYKQCGNGWTIDVIVHLLNSYKEKK